MKRVEQHRWNLWGFPKNMNVVADEVIRRAKAGGAFPILLMRSLGLHTDEKSRATGLFGLVWM